KDRLIKLLRHGDYNDNYYDSVSLFTDDIAKITKIKEENLPRISCEEEINIRDLTKWLPDYILARVDKMTMANSIECRVPFLSNAISDYAISLKDNRSGKEALREICKKLPMDTAAQKKKPFYIPLIDMAQDLARDNYNYFEDACIVKEKIIDKTYVDEIISKYNDSKLINSRKIWSLITLEECYKQFIIG
ncbi:MAG: asparagine synthase C-terminal domain-containing protein, partial [Candidatus Woesearchaeota archaeon]|nr:asparagine synthase C-terminal domain-containing protein [Candidatus Woesearchaeota archaeon]